MFAIIASFIAIASKYLFAFKKKHVFNPAAMGVFLPSLLGISSASWWVGTPILSLVVLTGGLLLVRKIQRFHMISTFFLLYAVVIAFYSIFNRLDALEVLFATFSSSPILFFAFVMLTEPSTAPPRQIHRTFYGGLIGILAFFQTLETALLIGNLLSYVISPKKKLILSLKEKKEIALGTYEFIFKKEEDYPYQPGQYLEWTIKTKHMDSRGNRRFFTIASSPTEEDFRIGIKAEQKKSAFKSSMIDMEVGDKILAGNLSGDFVFPSKSSSLVFIAGGIGITPFRSMIKYLLDKNLKLPITLFYSNKLASEIVYKDLLEEAQNKLGIKTIYTLTDVENVPPNWSGYTGRLNEEVFKKEIPDYKKKNYYLSGPHPMVIGFEEVLRGIGVGQSSIKKDFFPGYA
jgi:glycine betaine catabolism B